MQQCDITTGTTKSRYSAPPPPDLPFSDTAMGYRKNLFEIKSREYWTHKELGGGRDIIACRLWIQ